MHRVTAPLSVGSEAVMAVDWDRRFDLMQQHSGEHLISGVIHSRFGYENVGFHMGAEEITIDYSGELTRQQMQEVEDAVNRLIWRDLPCTVSVPDAETLRTIPYRSKKELPGAVRIVRFEDADICACCGLHVRRTGEIGLVKLLSVERFHSGCRMELLCGGRAVRRFQTVFDQNRQVSGLLSAKPDRTAEAVRTLRANLDAAKLRAGALEARLFALQAECYAGAPFVLLFEDALTPDSLRRLTDALVKRADGLCAVFTGADGAYQYALASKTGDLRELVRRLNAACHGRGGGKAGFVHGSGAASRSALEAFVASEGNGMLRSAVPAVSSVPARRASSLTVTNSTPRACRVSMIVSAASTLESDMSCSRMMSPGRTASITSAAIPSASLRRQSFGSTDHSTTGRSAQTVCASRSMEHASSERSAICDSSRNESCVGP